MTLWDSAQTLAPGSLTIFLAALAIALAFEFINGFHDTANAVATVIYTHSLPATPAVIYSGFMNFLGVLLGGVTVAFGIVHLLPVELLVSSNSSMALVMVFALLLSGIAWNLGTWYLGLPVSSSHTLIGSILGVGVANSLLNGNGLSGVNWHKAEEVGLALLLSPLLGFVLAGGLLLLLKRLVKAPELYVPPEGQAPPPGWIRATLIATCGGVSFAHGSNDGQKGMGLVLLILLGFLPAHYALNTRAPEHLAATKTALADLEPLAGPAAGEVKQLTADYAPRESFNDVTGDDRYPTRQRTVQLLEALDKQRQQVPEADRGRYDAAVATVKDSVEFVPLWVVVATALALGVGTTIGYKRVMVTVAEKIGKTHLTYAQGASAEVVAAGTIFLAVGLGLPVSTTHVVSSGIAGTMAANGSGIQGGTARKILLAWVGTLPGTMLLAGGLFTLGKWLFV